jgi:hypothetical protein
MTKILIIVLATVAVLAIEADRTVVHAGPWCLVGQGRDCGYYTIEQCLASRAGGSSHCEQNPNYQGSANRPARSERRR